MIIKIITTTTDSDIAANKIAEHLVRENLSPCVQITPNIQSVYKWQGTLLKSNEILLLIKTLPEKVQRCKKVIKKLHNYDVAEIIVADGEILNAEYRNWFLQNSR